MEENILDVVFNAVWETELDVFQFNALAESLDGNKHGEAWFEKTVGPMSGWNILPMKHQSLRKQNKSNMV